MLLKEKRKSKYSSVSWKKHSEIKALRLLFFNMYEHDKLFVLYKALPILFFFATVGENVTS